MTHLDCSVQNCMYNQDNSCSKESIHVDGSSASSTEDTCCKSFVERKEGAATNSTKEAVKPTDIACEAVNCMYNEDCRCDAEHIGIAGSDACDCEHTECASFRSK